MVQAMIPKALKPMTFYFSTVYQEIWVGVALTTYAYYKISYGGYKRLWCLKGPVCQFRLCLINPKPFTGCCKQ
uniref:Uncharacterized protein n=1 Tax=Geospiza parvula TaxID=87175 RepID=A0A8C3N0Z3_GEOPR